MAVELATLQTAVRVWVTAAVNDAGILVINAQGSGPRPSVPFVTVDLVGMDSPESDEKKPITIDAITAVSIALRQFTVAGDRTDYYVATGFVQVADSTANDDTYTVDSSVFAAGSTVVTVVEAIPDATVDGNLTGARVVFGTRFLDYQIDVIGTEPAAPRVPAMQRADVIRSALGLDAPLAALRAADLAFYVAHAVVPTWDLEETKREESAAFTVRLATDSQIVEWTGILERTTGTLNSDNPDGTANRIDTVTADLLAGPYDPGP